MHRRPNDQDPKGDTAGGVYLAADDAGNRQSPGPTTQSNPSVGEMKGTQASKGKAKRKGKRSGSSTKAHLGGFEGEVRGSEQEGPSNELGTGMSYLSRRRTQREGCGCVARDSARERAKGERAVDGASQRGTAEHGDEKADGAQEKKRDRDRDRERAGDGAGHGASYVTQRRQRRTVDAAMGPKGKGHEGHKAKGKGAPKFVDPSRTCNPPKPGLSLVCDPPADLDVSHQSDHKSSASCSQIGTATTSYARPSAPLPIRTSHRVLNAAGAVWAVAPE